MPASDNRLNPDLEIRYEREREDAYQAMEFRLGTATWGGKPPRESGFVSRQWSEGLLAMCLFQVSEDCYVDFNQALLYVITLQRSTVSVMLAELLDQIKLAMVFERSEQRS